MLVMNRVIIAGPLAKEPDLRTTKSGKHLCMLVVAARRRPTKDESVCFLKVVAWEGLADACASRLEKGNIILVEGYLTQSQWVDRAGNQRSTIQVSAEEIKFVTPALNKKRDGADINYTYDNTGSVGVGGSTTNDGYQDYDGYNENWQEESQHLSSPYSSDDIPSINDAPF